MYHLANRMFLNLKAMDFDRAVHHICQAISCVLHRHPQCAAGGGTVDYFGPKVAVLFSYVGSTHVYSPKKISVRCQVSKCQGIVFILVAVPLELSHSL